MGGEDPYDHEGDDGVAPENRFALTADQWDQFAKIMDKNPTPEQRDALTNLLNSKTIFDK